MYLNFNEFTGGIINEEEVNTHTHWFTLSGYEASGSGTLLPRIPLSCPSLGLRTDIKGNEGEWAGLSYVLLGNPSGMDEKWSLFSVTMTSNHQLWSWCEVSPLWAAVVLCNVYRAVGEKESYLWQLIHQHTQSPWNQITPMSNVHSLRDPTWVDRRYITRYYVWLMCVLQGMNYTFHYPLQWDLKDPSWRHQV